MKNSDAALPGVRAFIPGLNACRNPNPKIPILPLKTFACSYLTTMGKFSTPMNQGAMPAQPESLILSPVLGAPNLEYNARTLVIPRT